MKAVIRNLIIGENQYIDSYPQFRQVMLSGQLALISLTLCILLGVIEFWQGNTVPVILFTGTVLLLCLSIYCHRRQYHRLGHYLFLIPINLVCFLLVSSEDPQSGAFVHFISISLAAFIIFGYQQRMEAIFFAAMTFTLFLTAVAGGGSPLPYRQYTPDMLLMSRLINFSSASVACMMAIFLLIRLNHKNYVRLIENYQLLSKANAELDRFVYSTSHDLRAPLTSMLGLLNIAEMNSHPQDAKKYYAMMRDRIFTLDKFIRDITDYSRNNRMALTLQPVKIAELVHEIWDMVKYTPEAQEVSFQVEVPAHSEVETDVNRLKTVLLNLISNSLRYHDPRKPERYIRLRYQHKGRGFHIKVEDNGQGIDPAYHTKVFDMFFRASDKSHGSGLGLYIVKETVAKLSGSIQLESTPGVGSTFIVKLPA